MPKIDDIAIKVGVGTAQISSFRGPLHRWSQDNGTQRSRTLAQLLCL